MAHELIRRGLLPEWGSVLVERQSSGRGQLRREWVSPPGNVYAAWRLPMTGPFAAEAAAPAVGALVAEALTRMGCRVALKWPNDILRAPHGESCPSPRWRKVGGILLEERGGALVAGIGLNLAAAPEADRLRPEAAFAAGRLTPPDAAGELSPALCWARLASEAISCYFSWSAQTAATPWLALAEKHLAFRGCMVRLEDGESCQEGIVDGLCLSGALRLRTTSGVMTFLGGSLLPGWGNYGL